MARRSTGKRLRFEVFKRDHFTCQYCGAQPPSVVLVLDHSTPVVAGGTSTIDNLVTACEPCNQGKADKPVGHAAVRPDADLLYLETQQEIAELRRYQEALAAKEVELEKLVWLLQEEWIRIAGNLDWHPADHVVRQMLRRYSPEVVRDALVDVAAKVEGGYLERHKWLPYLWAVARNTAREVGDA